MEQYDTISWLYEVLYVGYSKEEMGQDFIEEHGKLFNRYRNGRFHDALLEACRESGFMVEKNTFNMDEDRYYVYLRK